MAEACSIDSSKSIFISSRDVSESEVSLSSVLISSSTSLVLLGGSTGSSILWSLSSSIDLRSLIAFKKSNDVFPNASWS